MSTLWISIVDGEWRYGVTAYRVVDMTPGTLTAIPRFYLYHGWDMLCAFSTLLGAMQTARQLFLADMGLGSGALELDRDADDSAK